MSDLSIEPAESQVEVNIPRLLFTSAEHGAGVSTVFLGLLVALSKAGVGTAIANIGPSLIQTTHYRRISGRFAHTIDLWSLSREQAVQSFAKLSAGAELVLFSGDVGIYDHLFPSCWVPHEAGIAEALNMPIVLVLDAEGYRETISALIKGLMDYWPNAKIAGVIANRIRSKKHNYLIRKAVESLNGPLYLGGVSIGDPAVIGEPEGPDSNPSLLPRSRILGCGDLVSKSIDIQSLLSIAKSSGAIKVPTTALASSSGRCRIAVADDVAFHLTIQDNLDLLRRAGAKLVAFSPIADYKLPSDINAVYLPSGYMQIYAADLQKNEGMLNELAAFAQRGGLIFAEGSAASYLCRKIVLSNGEIYNTVGIIPAVANAVRADTDWGNPLYCEITSVNKSPISKKGQMARGYRDPRWLVRIEGKIPFAFKVLEVDITSGEGSKGQLVYEDDGLMPLPNVIATTVQIHWASNPSLADNFIAHMTGGEPL